MMTSADKEKLVIISGVSRGLGLAIARNLLSKGYAVAGFSSSLSNEVQELLAVNEHKFFWKHLNIADSKQIDSGVMQVINMFSEHSLWGVINNAAISIDGVLATLPVIDIEKVIQTNLTGSIVLTRSVMRQLLQQRSGGRVINISSITGQRGYSGLSSYAASKAGMDGFTRALSREVGRIGVTVNSIAPGYMRTALSAGLNDKQLDQIVRRTPLGRLCELNDIVNLVDFLLSDLADFITGQTITVDGGLTS